MSRQRHFAKYTAIPDGIGTSAVLDRTTDQVVKGTEGLPPEDATQLARDWSRHEPPEVER